MQGGLGQGIGVALGVKLALGPERLVAFTVGDGSWLYNPVLPGLMASAEYGLPVLIVVFNNGKYLSMRHNHRRVYPDSVAARTGYQLGVDLTAQPDVAAVATAAGAAGLHGDRRQGTRARAGQGDRQRPRGPYRRRQHLPDPLAHTNRIQGGGMMSAETPRAAGKVLVSADDLRALVAGMFAARGVRAADAAAVADALVWANLRGVDSHGVSRVPRYLELFDKGESVADAEVTVQRPRAAIAIVDAHAAPGPVAMNRAADEAVAGARECGIGWASVRGTVHTGAIGYYTSRVADAGHGGGRRGGGRAEHGLRRRAGRGRRHQPARPSRCRRAVTIWCCSTWPPRSWRSAGSPSSRRQARNCRPASASPPTASRPPTRRWPRSPSRSAGRRGRA